MTLGDFLSKFIGGNGHGSNGGNGSGNNGGIRVREGDTPTNLAEIYGTRKGADRRNPNPNLSIDQRRIDPNKPLVNLVSDNYSKLCAYTAAQSAREINANVSGDVSIQAFDDLRMQHVAPLIRSLFVNQDGEFNKLQSLSAEQNAGQNVEQVIEAWEKVKTALPYSTDANTKQLSLTPVTTHDYYSLNSTRARLGNILTLWYGLQAEGVKVREQDLDGLVAGAEQLMLGDSDGIKPFVPYLVAFPQIRTKIRELYQGITKKIPKDNESAAHRLLETRQNLFCGTLATELVNLGYNVISTNPLLDIVRKHANSFRKYIVAHKELYAKTNGTDDDKSNRRDPSNNSYIAKVIALRRKYLEAFVRDLYTNQDGTFKSDLKFSAFDVAEAWNELSKLMPYSNGQDGKPRPVITPHIYDGPNRAVIQNQETTQEDFYVVNHTRKELAAMILLRGGLEGIDLSQEEVQDIIVGSFCLGNKNGILPADVSRYFAQRGIKLDTERILGLTPLYPLLFTTDPREALNQEEVPLSQTGQQIVARINELYGNMNTHSRITSKNGLPGLPPEIRENFSQLPVLLGYYGVGVTGKPDKHELVGAQLQQI